jgi:hypothetical protein
MKASEHVTKFLEWVKNSPYQKLNENFIKFEDTSSYFDDYKKLEEVIGLHLPNSFFNFLKECGRMIFDISFIDPLDIFQDYEDSINKKIYWHIGAPISNGLVIMTPDEMVNFHEAILFGLGKHHARGSNWYPIATAKSDMEEGWLIDQTFNDENFNNPIAPFYTDSIFRYDNTLENDEKLTMSFDNFDDFIGDYFFRIKRQLLQQNSQEIRVLIENHT